jgi:pyrophosphate--fructose-6-phosphate 1-phosphotransferase
VLAEYLLKHGSPTRVVGVPKTIDGDLKNACVEISFGFDTACKTYAEIIGNIEADAVSAGKYYHCIKLMGRSASHVALECALVTRPNLAWIGEEIAERRLGLADLVEEMVTLVLERAKRGKHYGVMLIPEGIVECIPEMGVLIEEINALLAQSQEVEGKLSKGAQETWGMLPKEIQQQLLSKRDPHGNVHVSSIETEKLFLTLVKARVQISAVHHFLGYEGRSGFPSQFDCNYCYALGHVAALLIARGKTGYMACVQHLTAPSEQWKIAAVPLSSLMHLEKRKGVLKPVIAKALVGREDPAFLHFQKERASWRLEDHYHNPGPIQFGGDPALCDSVPLSVRLNA